MMHYIVHIGDLSDQRMNEMVDFCVENGLKLVKFDNMDISDASYKWDMMASFYFETEADLLVFKLRFNTK